MRGSAAVLAGLALAIGLAGGAAPMPASAAPRSIVEDDAALLRETPRMRDRTLDDMSVLGADTVRIMVLWRDAPGVWPALEAAVDGAQARGLEVLLTLSGPGPAAVSGCRPRDGLCRPDPEAYGRFVAEAGARFPTVRRWSLWNEPNVPTWLRPQSVVRRGRVVLTSPTLYRALAREGAAALARTGHAKDTILVGETAPVHDGRTGPAARRPTAPLRFARAVLAGGPVPGTGWAHHAYTGGGVRDPAIRGPAALLGPTEIGALERALDRHAATRGFGVWLTEAGFQTNPPDPYFGVGPATQAAWMNETDWLLHGDRRIRSVAQYLVTDEQRQSSFQSGVRYADGRPKPSFAAYRAPLWIAQRGGGTIAVWGRVRPGGARLIALERRAPGAQSWRVMRLRGRGVERRVHEAARPGTEYRLRWRDARGVVHLSRTARAVASRASRPRAAGR
jgi:hypothetical protein